MNKPLKRIMATLFSVACVGTFFSCAKAEEERAVIKIYSPDGAPALALAKVMSEERKNEKYTIVDASTLPALVGGEDPEPDLCVMPLNLATKLFSNGEKYRLFGTVTHGNLFLLSKDGTTFSTGAALAKLKGKTVGVIQINNVPGLTFMSILNDNGIDYTELKNDDEPKADKVNLVAVSDPATEITPNGACDFYVCAEPLVSVKTAKTSLKIAGNLQALYGDGKGYPQAVIMVKNGFANANTEWLLSYKNELSLAKEWLETADAETIVNAVSSHLTEGLTPTFSKANLSSETVKNCGVWFEDATAGKDGIENILNKYLTIAPQSCVRVSGSFFYGLEE